MKILHIVPWYKPAYIYGGPINSVSKLCEQLQNSGVDVMVYTSAANGKNELDVETSKVIDRDGVAVMYFDRVTKDNTHASPALWKYLLKHVKEYDVVHIHSWWNLLVVVAALICHSRGAKVIISPRGMLSNYILTKNHSVQKWWLHKLIGRAALAKCVFHATSRVEYDECEKLIPGWKGFLAPNILSFPDITVHKEPNDVFTILFLGRIDHKKGIEFVLEAMAKLDTKVILNVCGSGEEDYITELKNLSDRLNVSDQVNWLGWKSNDEKFTLLMQADLLVLISYNENFANVVIESLYMGTPVLISEHVGLADFVKDEDMGWVCALDSGSVTDTLNQAVLDIEKLKRINDTGRASILEHFSEDMTIKKYIDQYQSLIQAKMIPA